LTVVRAPKPNPMRTFTAFIVAHHSSAFPTEGAIDVSVTLLVSLTWALASGHA
jgi:hypothetical protein